MRRVDFGAVLVRLEHDRGARQRDEESGEGGGVRLPAECDGDADGRKHREQHLQAAACDDDAGGSHHLPERELEPDGKQQQSDADLGEKGDVLARLDYAEAVGPDRDASRDESDEHGLPQLIEKKDDRD